MQNNNYKNTDESLSMIVLGILSVYILIVTFILYLCFLHRISEIAGVIGIIVFTLIYIPRFLILKKLKNKDIIKILDNSISINGMEIPFSEIEGYSVDVKRPQAVFFFNAQTVIFQEAAFSLKLKNGQVAFNVIGSEKISLLRAFFEELKNTDI